MGPLEAKRGRIRVVESTDPAAGQEAKIQQEDGLRWRLISASIILVCSADVADRGVFLRTIVGGVTVGNWPVAKSFASGATAILSWGSGAGVAGVATLAYQAAGIPDDCWLNDSAQVEASAQNLQALDNFGKLSILVEEFIDVIS